MRNGHVANLPEKDILINPRNIFFWNVVRIYEMQPTHLNRKDNTLVLPSAQCWVEMSISGTFVTNVPLMDYMLN